MKIAVLAICLMVAGPVLAESQSSGQNEFTNLILAASMAAKSESSCGEKRCYIPGVDCTGSYKVVNSYNGCTGITNGGSASYWTGDECIGGFGQGD